ncbi:MAG TPA: helix-turn-helix domain-containing protein [Bryobacteraceae bacterium]
MESVGEKLRTARLQKGLTLEELYDKTRISLKNLQAIEGDDMSRFHSPFFYKSFARQIADQLGLEYPMLAPAVDAAAGTIPEPPMPGQTDAPVEKAAASVRRSKRSRMRWLFSLGSLLTTFALCSAAYAAWGGSQSNHQTASHRPAHVSVAHLNWNAE